MKSLRPVQVNSRDKEKIFELREEQKELREELAKREEELQKCKERLIELAIIFREAKKYLAGEEHKIEVTNESYEIASWKCRKMRDNVYPEICMIPQSRI